MTYHVSHIHNKHDFQCNRIGILFLFVCLLYHRYPNSSDSPTSSIQVPFWRRLRFGTNRSLTEQKSIISWRQIKQYKATKYCFLYFKKVFFNVFHHLPSMFNVVNFVIMPSASPMRSAKAPVGSRPISIPSTSTSIFKTCAEPYNDGMQRIIFTWYVQRCDVIERRKHCCEGGES